MTDNNHEKLEKRLGLIDVYAISTGAMFASGFFLLPGVAAAKTGPSVILAYFLASLLMIPAVLAIAELSTTMPRAGGPYFFIDRSFGPLLGTIGGIGAWLVLILKSSFALVGMGAYLSLLLDFPIEPLALALTAGFAALNILGAKESARLQRLLVTGLVFLTTLYVANGLWWIAEEGLLEVGRREMVPFFAFGLEALPATIGMVFVSYAGLTKVANIAEEVKRPERNIPLGMAAALLTVSVIYVLGVFVMIAALPPGILHHDLTPVATAGRRFLTWMPADLGLYLILAAAIAAFASTGNAGIMAASRLPLAMARDGLVCEPLGKVGRFGTPTLSVLLTAGLMAFAIAALDVEALARLASAFLLFIFALLNLSLIVLRESRIESYLPIFRVPLYPWMPIAGIVTSIALIFVLGWFYVLFLTAVCIVSSLWYRLYAAARVERRGAVFNLFERLAQHKHEPLEEELWGVLKERGPTRSDLFDEVVALSRVIDFPTETRFDRVVHQAAERLSQELGMDGETLSGLLRQSGGPGGPPVSGEAVLVDLRLPSIEHPKMVLARLRAGVRRNEVSRVVGDPVHPSEVAPTPVIHAALFLVSPEERASQHLRILTELSARVDDPAFLQVWQDAASPQDLREVFLRGDRFLLMRLSQGSASGEFIGRPLEEISLPREAVVAAIHRNGEPRPPEPGEVLREGDRLVIVGEPGAIRRVHERYGTVGPPS